MKRLLERVEFPLLRLSLGAGLLALYGAVGAGAPLPGVVRLLVAAIALSYWPGAMLRRFFLVEHEIEWPGGIAIGFALGLGLACAINVAAAWCGFDPGVVLWVLPTVGLLLACIRPARPVEPPEPRGHLPWTILAGVAILTSLVVGTLGAPLMTDTDSPDHIATVRRIAETRVVLPNDAFFADAGVHGADPRKGVYHAWVATVVRASHVDPVDAWRWLPLLFIPTFLLAVAAFTWKLTNSRMSALLAAILFPLVYGGGLGGTELRETVYSTRIGELVALLAAACLVRFIERGGKRRLALFVAVGWTAIAVHLWIVLYFAVAFGVYALGTLAVRRWRATWTRFAAAAVGLGVPALPYLLWRKGQSYGPQNEIHTEPQGLFYVTDRLYMVDPQAMWTWSGIWLVVALAAAPWFWSRRGNSTGSIYLALVPWAVVLVVLNPFLLPPAHQALGYLVMRLIWIVPVIPAVATVLTAVGKVALRGAGRARAFALAGAAAAVVLLVPAAQQAISNVTDRDLLRAQEAERGPAAWMDLLEWLRDEYPREKVLLSDPGTCYSIPAYTGHQVTAYLDQHSSPNDPRGLTRILDARDVLSPTVDHRRTLELLRAYGADAVVVNQRFIQPIAFDYWTVEPQLYAATRAKFAAHPEWFRPVYDVRGATVYELTDAAKRGPLPPPEEMPRPVLPPDEAARVAATVTPIADGIFLQYGTQSARPTYAPGDTIDFVTLWALAPGQTARPGSWTIYVRLDGAEPRGPLYSDLWQKPYRKALERVTGRKWRARESHRPLNGVFGPDRWRAGEIVADASTFAVPRELTPGDYEVRVRMVRMPHYANTRLRDYLSDDDLFNGPLVGHVRIEAPR